jgi:hypothetical protein
MRDNRGAYEALSYTWRTAREGHWGQPKKTKPSIPVIECNGQEVTVGANLYTVARESSKAFSGVCSAVSTWAATAGGKHTILLERPQYYIRGSGTRSWSVADELLSAESMVWLEVLRLYTLRWFSRPWVVQEIALARRATAIWGACEMSWEWIGLAAAIIRTN